MNDTVLVSGIKNTLQESLSSGRQISMQNIADKYSAKRATVRHIIDNNKILKDLYNQVKKPFGGKWQAKEDTLKAVSAAIMAASMYGITVGQNNEDLMIDEIDFGADLARNIELCTKGNKEAEEVLLKAFNVFPGFIADMVSMTNQNNLYRVMLADPIKDVIKAYKMDSEYTEALVFAKDEKGDFKYSLSEIKPMVYVKNEAPELLDLALSEPKLIISLLQQKDGDGKPRFGIDGIRALYDCYKKLPKFTEHLISQAERNEKGTFYRFSERGICKIIDSYLSGDSNFPFDLVNYEGKFYKLSLKYSEEQIIKILETSEKYDILGLISELQKLKLSPDIISNLISSISDEKVSFAYKLFNMRNYMNDAETFEKIINIAEEKNLTDKDNIEILRLAKTVIYNYGWSSFVDNILKNFQDCIDCRETNK